MSGCGNCCGSCGSCGEMILSPGEVDMLRKLGQIPFLPAVRRVDDPTPYYLEDDDYSKKEYSLILQCLEKRRLIDLDFRKPLSGDYRNAEPNHLKGSFALTERGQQVLELIEIHGV